MYSNVVVYARELLGVCYFDSRWEKQISALHSHFMKSDETDDFLDGSTMSLIKLERLIVKSNFVCAAC